MQKLLLAILLLFSQMVFAQRGFLYVKKHGYKKVKTFEEGSFIRLQTSKGAASGFLTLVTKDSVSINNKWFALSEIQKIILRDKKPFFTSDNTKTFLLTTAGVILSTAGMTLAKWAKFDKALAYSAGIGYGNYLIRFFPKFKRKQYTIGKKYSLQALDLHF